MGHFWEVYMTEFPKKVFQESKVCVLMTVYWGSIGKKKGEFMLRRAIESILCQTYKLFRFIIVIDDPNNQEDMKLIIESYKSTKIYAWANGKNEGLTYSLNKALDIIDEDFIMRQDADDFSHPQRMEKQLAKIKTDDKIGAVGDNYGVIENGKWTITNGANPENNRITDLAGAIAGTSMIRTSAVKEVGGWKYEFAQDFYMWVRMRQLGYRIVSLKETVYWLTVHKDQISQAKRDRQKACHRQIIEEVCNVR